ncbi:MAG: DUF3244 domain-containing protein [Bacteroidales bacterium]|nr:DUF3244 domain-containing protein [Bacteroidales bacterium]
MLRHLLIICLALSAAIHCVADDTPVIVNLDFTNKSQSHVSRPHRVPMSIDIQACYYSDANSLVIVANGDIDASVAIYNQSDLMVDYSSAIPASFDLSCLPAGTYTVVIEHDSWVATGELYLTH